ncbi:MAG TPA: hypothetical protein VGN34_29000 [Ktedonobacteraceae bacterium]
MNAAQAASQPLPLSVSFNYDNLFKIQRVRNPFVLSPVSYSSLASYLECPWCMLVQKRKKRTKEPTQMTQARQTTLFGKGCPDPRMVGTLLHTIVNLLHDEKGPLAQDLRIRLLDNTDALARFIQQDLLQALQQAGKMNLAIFFNELSYDKRTLATTISAPILRYQQELAKTNTTVFTASERFQCKLLSTKNTFAEHPDRGGYVCLIGEFDQIRLRHEPGQNPRKHHGIPVIIEFKKGLGGKKKAATSLPGLFAELTEEEEEANEVVQPTHAHAMQLMTYWLAFQTRWNKNEQYKEARGFLQEIPMSLCQPMELILYNLNDGCQYQLEPSDYREALVALIECIFYLNWAMKSGYAWQAPEHECRRAQLTELPAHAIQVQVGSMPITGQECYLLAKAAFDRFKETIRWKQITR